MFIIGIKLVSSYITGVVSIKLKISKLKKLEVKRRKIKFIQQRTWARWKLSSTFTIFLKFYLFKSWKTTGFLKETNIVSKLKYDAIMVIWKSSFSKNLVNSSKESPSWSFKYVFSLKKPYCFTVSLCWFPHGKEIIRES